MRRARLLAVIARAIPALWLAAAMTHAAAAAPALASTAAPAGSGATGAITREWRFAVTLDSIPIGEHRYLVSDDAGNLKADIDARFRVRLVVVDAYAWEQHVDETWHGECLTQLRSRTVEQGRASSVSGHAQGDRFVVQGPAGDAVIEACPMTFAYWNPHVLERRQLLNAQTGAYTPVEVENLGRDTQSVRGRPTRTQHYRMRTPRNTIELWYAGDGEWVAMRTTTPQGHVLFYRLV
jgi:hypothetical protein